MIKKATSIRRMFLIISHHLFIFFGFCFFKDIYNLIRKKSIFRDF